SFSATSARRRAPTSSGCCGSSTQPILRVYGGHPAAQAFERAQERPRADLGRAALGIAWRKCAQEPELERDRLEAALQENVMRVVVRVDEARHQQLVGRVDRLID